MKERPFWTERDHKDIEKVFKRAIRRNKKRMKKQRCYRVTAEFNPIRKEGDFRLSLEAKYA